MAGSILDCSPPFSVVLPSMSLVITVSVHVNPASELRKTDTAFRPSTVHVAMYIGLLGSMAIADSASRSPSLLELTCVPFELPTSVGVNEPVLARSNVADNCSRCSSCSIAYRNTLNDCLGPAKK
jgi:hypothetical protein